MPSFQSFRTTAADLVARFKRDFDAYHSKGYDEATLRLQFLDPLFRALGWDVLNEGGFPPHLCDVVVESRTDIEGRQKRADYVFRFGGMPKLVCEAKKPSEDLARHAFQIQNYTYNLSLYVGVLTNFERLSLYVVGAKPDRACPFEAAQTFHFLDYESDAQALWDLFAKENVANGSIDKFVASLPKAPSRGGKRGWLFRPDRTKTVDVDFLEFLDTARRRFAKSLVNCNPKLDWGDDGLNESVQRIIDRILFVRICEDRGIDTFTPLDQILNSWKAAGSKESLLYPALVAHFRKLAPAFNGGLFGKIGSSPHFSEGLHVDDRVLADFLDDLSADDSNYLFSTIPIDILGSVYERFLGKVIRVTPSGQVRVDLKPEARKTGGVYYTPPHVVKLIVAKTISQLIQHNSPRELSRVRIVDPACGSGSFLIQAFERLSEHYLEWFLAHPKAQKPTLCYRDAQNSLHLTSNLKRTILVNNLFGVDVDPQAVEVTQLSLYLKILENETRNSLAAQRSLFPGEAFLPDLSRNIQCGNSVIGTDYMDLFNGADTSAALRPFDWRSAFPGLSGFNAVIGNPPWISLSGKFGADIYPPTMVEYLISHYHGNTYMPNMYEYFVRAGLGLLAPGGLFSFIVPDRLAFNGQFVQLRKLIATEYQIEELIFNVPFPGITADTLIFVIRAAHPSTDHSVRTSEFGREVTSRSQAEFVGDPNCVFEYFGDGAAMNLVKRMYGMASVKMLGDLFDSTSGFGGKSKLISETKRKNTQIETLKGDSINRYQLQKLYWFEFARKNITGRTTDPDKLGATPKVLIRKTGDRIIATYDDSGVYPEQSLYFLFNQKGEVEFKSVLAILNSRLMTFLFRARAVTNRNSIAQVKKVDLDRLPICRVGLEENRLLSRHVDQLLNLRKRMSGVKAESTRAALHRMIAAAEAKIDAAVYGLYGLSKKEIGLVERSAQEEGGPQ